MSGRAWFLGLIVVILAGLGVRELIFWWKHQR